MDGDDRLRTPVGAGCLLASGAGIRRRLPPEGFGSWAEWLTYAGVPPEEWDDGDYIEDPDGVGPGISFLKVPEPKVAKNRVHMDVQAGGGRGVPWEKRWPRVTAAVERLTAAGATVIREDAQNGYPGPRGDGRFRRGTSSACSDSGVQSQPSTRMERTSPRSSSTCCSPG